MPPAMDAAANENEVRLRKGTSLNERLVLAGIAAVLCLIALPGLAHLADGNWLGIAALFALLFGCLLLVAALFDRNVVWIITPGEILIGEQRPFGKLHRRSIRDDEISGMRLRKSIGKSVEFTLVIETESGDTLTSPPLPDVTQVQKTTLQVAWLLQLPAPELVENPLDAANPRIRLGKPVSSKRVRAYRALVLLLGCSLSLPFIYALWSGKLSALGIAVWSLGAIMAFLLIRYLYRTSAFWIVHDGAIRFERLSLKGTIETGTFGGDNVERIDVESGGRRGSHYAIAIRLRTGRKIRSPVLVGKDQTRAVRAEIVRRLGLNPPDGR
ncbi:hypothetical protein J6524_33630 [Bradyrhizobium sp. WSM 1738]|uniref:hypothetical protein n=1 Tax=Bradyrhizobium hereditatis TaxID=2821405 RepID=UPI001CE2C567|nr:hypothetical protein [Bradyrhizobium hereditatis]MCA6119780.1 hypothetical protein [Bradyrhizobium hereditatis]